MKSGVVYLKLPQNAQVVNRKILLSDVAEIYTVDAGMGKNRRTDFIYGWR